MRKFFVGLTAMVATLGLLVAPAAAVPTSGLTPDPLVAASDVTATMDVDQLAPTTGSQCEFLTQTRYLHTYVLTNLDDPSITVELELEYIMLHDGQQHTTTVADTDFIPNLPGAWSVKKTTSTLGGVSTVPNPGYSAGPFPQPCGRFVGTATSQTSNVEVAANASIPVVHLPTTLAVLVVGGGSWFVYNRRQQVIA